MHTYSHPMWSAIFPRLWMLQNHDLCQYTHCWMCECSSCCVYTGKNAVRDFKWKLHSKSKSKRHVLSVLCTLLWREFNHLKNNAHQQILFLSRFFVVNISKTRPNCKSINFVRFQVIVRNQRPNWHLYTHFRSKCK